MSADNSEGALNETHNHRSWGFVGGFIDGLSSGGRSSPIGVWLPAIMVVGNELGIVRRVWFAHSMQISAAHAVWRMLLLAAPYLMYLGVRRGVRNMSKDGEIGADVDLWLRSSVDSLIFITYLCLTFICNW